MLPTQGPHRVNSGGQIPSLSKIPIKPGSCSVQTQEMGVHLAEAEAKATIRIAASRHRIRSIFVVVVSTISLRWLNLQRGFLFHFMLLL